MEKETELVPVETVRTDIAPYAAPNVAELLQIVVQKIGGEGAAAAVDAVSKLVELDQKLRAADAERQFNAALIEFKKVCPAIPRAKSSGGTGRDSGAKFKYKFADLETIAAVIDPYLHANGLTYTWDHRQDGDRVTAICILRHVGGHSISSPFTIPIDPKGFMSPTQQYGTAKTYASRYSLISVLGLTTCDEDTDGMTPQDVETITENQQVTLQALLEELGYTTPESRTRFLKWLGYETLADVRRGDYSKAIDALEKKRREQ